MFGIAAGGAVQVGVNFRLKSEDIHYIFKHAEVWLITYIPIDSVPWLTLCERKVDLIIVDREFLHLLDGFDPLVRLIVDDDTDATEGELSGEFDNIIGQGLEYDRLFGSGWDGLQAEADDEEDVMALAYTSGTTAKPKVSNSISRRNIDTDGLIGSRIYTSRHISRCFDKRY